MGGPGATRRGHKRGWGTMIIKCESNRDGGNEVKIWGREIYRDPITETEESDVRYGESRWVPKGGKPTTYKDRYGNLIPCGCSKSLLYFR